MMNSQIVPPVRDLNANVPVNKGDVIKHLVQQCFCIIQFLKLIFFSSLFERLWNIN